MTSNLESIFTCFGVGGSNNIFSLGQLRLLLLFFLSLITETIPTERDISVKLKSFLLPETSLNTSRDRLVVNIQPWIWKYFLGSSSSLWLTFPPSSSCTNSPLQTFPSNESPSARREFEITINRNVSNSVGIVPARLEQQAQPVSDDNKQDYVAAGLWRSAEFKSDPSFKNNEILL